MLSSGKKIIRKIRILNEEGYFQATGTKNEKIMKGSGELAIDIE